MASKIKGQTMYLPITPYKVAGCEEEFNELSVTVNFDDRRKYFYVSVHAGWKSSWGSHGCIIMGDQDPLTAPQFFVVKESPKNSQKYLDQMYANLELAKEAISFYFNKRKWLELRSLVIVVAAFGYTENADKRVKADMAKENSSDNNQNNSEDKVMTNENVKVADLIGKSVCNGNAKYVIKSLDGDKVTVDFAMGDNAAKEMNMKAEQIEKLLQGGWTVGEGAQEPTAKQEQAKTEEPAAKTVKMETEPKPKQEQPAKPRKKQPQTEAKAEEPKPKAEQPKGRLTYSTYTNNKGKACAKISGFAETDAAYQKEAAASLHGSASYEMVKSERVNFLTFGPRYAEVAKTVCQMLNDGKTVADCQAVVDAATEERMAKREERKQKRETYRQEREEHGAANLKPETKVNGKAYSSADVAAILQKVMAGGKLPKDIEEAMMKAA